MRLGHLIDLNGEAGRFSEGLAGLDRCKRHQMANGMDRGWAKTTSYLDWLVSYGVQQLLLSERHWTGIPAGPSCLDHGHDPLPRLRIP